MSPWRNHGLYYGDYTVDGARFRPALRDRKGRPIPADPEHWEEAVRSEEREKSKVERGEPSNRPLSYARLPFDKAVDTYLAELAVQRPESVRQPGQPRKSWEGDLTNRLRPFFGTKRLYQITADDIRTFQAKRLQKGKHPKTVNHEVQALLRLLKRAKLLSRIRDEVKLLPVRREPRQMITPAEKQRLFETAAKRPSWQRAYCAALLTANGSMRPVELRRLLWRDLDPFDRTLRIRLSKTEAATRVIPLNDEAWAAVAALKQSADALGTYAPDNFIFHREWPRDDGTKPMGKGGWRTAWRNLREEAAREDKERGVEAMPKLATFRYYDLRHLFVTELNEAGVPEGVIRELAGHVDPQMMRIYSHPRLAAKRLAVEALTTVKPSTDNASPDGKRVINRVIKALPAAAVDAEVIERNGRGAQI